MLLDLPFQALHSAMRNPFRSLLTILGLSFGVTAFGASMLTGLGASKGLWEELQELVENVVEVHWSYVDVSRRSMTIPPKNLDSEDVKMIQSIEGVTNVLPMLVRARIKVRQGNDTIGTRLECVSTTAQGTRYFQLNRGRPFLPAEKNGFVKSCYIGLDVAKALFGGADETLGQKIYLNGFPFTVVGVLTYKPDFLRRNYNYRVVVPMNTAKDIIPLSNSYDVIHIEIAPDASTANIVKTVDRLLIQAHGLRNYSIEIPEEIVEKRRRIFYGVISVVVILSFICLTVSGVGIMNVLLFSVKERTKEIGIRLACGSPPRSIFFLVTSEALILCAFGGLIGCLLAYPMALGLCRAASLFVTDCVHLAPEFHFGSIAADFGIAMLTGIFSGAYPSYIASRMEPAECFMK